MQIRELVQFSKERCFNGAVQTEWFYDKNRVKSVAESYVFHGPKYFGVSEKDVALGGHRLIDTASFALNIANKLNDEHPENNFVLTIAGYGAGKSHLAVSLAALFSGNNDLSQVVESNISLADAEIANKIIAVNQKKNLILVLNGMNNFNLDAEVLRCARLTLAQNNMDDSVLKGLTKSYNIASQFVEKTFAMCELQFESAAKSYGIDLKSNGLKEFILETIETRNDTLEIVNAVYTEITGDSISWDRGLSAGDILIELQSNLCGTNKPFNTFYYMAYKDKYILCYFGNEKLAPKHVADNIFKKGKLQPNEFAKIRLQKNAFVDVDLVKELCEEIMVSSSVEKCNEYKRKLSDLLAQEGTTPENQILVASATTRLDEGIGLKDSLYEKLNKGQAQLSEAKKNLGIQAMVKILAYFVNTTGIIQEGLPFVYSEDFIKQMDSLKKNTDTLLKKKAQQAIQNFTCNITQLSQFKSICKNLATILRNNNYAEYAVELESRVRDVEENLLAKQKYQERLVELDRDIAMLVDISTLGYV